MKIHCDWVAGQDWVIIADELFDPAIHVPYDQPKPAPVVAPSPVVADEEADKPRRGRR